MIDEPDQPKMEIARIPYVDGLGQEIRRIGRTAGVRCSFFMPNMLRNLYEAKDFLPQETTTNAVYSVTCKSCDTEYIGETKHAIRIREKEHRDAVRLGQCAKSAVAEHVHASVYRMKSIGAACRSLTEQEEKWSARFGRLSTSTNRNQL